MIWLNNCNRHFCKICPLETPITKTKNAKISSRIANPDYRYLRQQS